MQIDAQKFLDLTEETHQLCFYDIEATGLRGDYNSVLCVSIKPYDLPPYTFVVKRAGDDKKVIAEVKDALERYTCWAGYYSKGFDKPMINTRLLVHGMKPLNPTLHIDMYYTLKANLLTARRSQGHLLQWLGTPDQKMGVSAEVWNQVLANPKRELPKMVARCESDVIGLEQLYKRTRHLIKDITR